MPLRRPLAIAAVAVCLLAVHPGAARTQAAPTSRLSPRLPLDPAPSRVPEAAIGAELLQNARPFLRPAASLASAVGAFPNDGVVELYHLRYEQVMPSGLSGLVEQRVFEVRNAEAADLFALDDLWYDSARTSFQLTYARVLRPDPSAPGGWRVEGAGRDLGDLRAGVEGNEPRRVELPQVHAGDRVSVVYELLPDTRHDWSLLGGNFVGNLFAFRDSFSTLHARYVLAARRPMTTAQVGVAPPHMDQLGDGTRLWSWETDNLTAFFSSPDGPSITDSSPFVQVSGFSSWAAMSTWYSDVLAQRARLAPAVEQHLLGITGRAPANATPAQTEAIVDRAWGYLSNHLNYRGDEAGIHAYVPAPVSEVLQSGEGDCKDGALLLTTWLRAAGVEANLALVRTPDLGRVAPAAASGGGAATMAAFDHALVYVPATGQWIDTTAPDFLDTELPSSDQSSLALIVRTGQRRLVQIPAAPASANLTVRQVQLVPEPGGWLQATGEIEVRGADAPSMRQRYADRNQWRSELGSWLGEHFSGARVDTVTVSGVHPSAATVRVKFHAEIPPQQMRIAWIRSSYANLMASEVEREQELELPSRWRLEGDWSLQLGNAHACEGWPAPQGYRRVGRFGGLTVRFGCTQGKYQVQYQVIQAARVIEPNEYAAFRAFWRAVDQTLRAPAPMPRRLPTTPLIATNVATLR